MAVFNLLGGMIEISLDDIDTVLALPIYDKAYSEGLRLQKIFNLYDPDSELSRLNRKRKLKVSRELLFVIEKCLEYCRIHEHYDISKGRLYLARKQGKNAAISCTYKDIQVKDNIIKLAHPEIIVDLGSAAKGYIGDMMREVLKTEGVESGFIDLRGDIVVFGKEREVRIQHPRDPSSPLRTFSLTDKTVATSGDYRQYTHAYSNSHLGQSDIISSTVIAEELFTADLLATCIFVSGTKALDKFNKEKFIIMTDNQDLIENEAAD